MNSDLRTASEAESPRQSRSLLKTLIWIVLAVAIECVLLFCLAALGFALFWLV